MTWTYFAMQNDTGGSLVNSVHSCLHAEHVFAASMVVCGAERTPTANVICLS